MRRKTISFLKNLIEAGYEVLEFFIDVLSLIVDYVSIRFLFVFYPKKRIASMFGGQDEVENFYPECVDSVAIHLLTSWLDSDYESYKLGLSEFVERWHLGEKDYPLEKKKKTISTIDWYRIHCF